MKNKKKNIEKQESEQIEETNVREDGVADPVLNANVVDQTFEYNDEHLKKIEEERQLFLAKYKRANSLKWVFSILGLALLITTWILIPNLSNGEKWGTTVLVVVVLAILVCLLTYSILTKRSLNTKMHDYFALFYKESNMFVFDNEKFKKVELQNPDKITKDQFTDNQLYKDIYEVGSRGLTSFEYNGIPTMICDCAGQIKTNKRIAPVFVGKYLFAPANYNSDDRLIIYIKGDQRSLPPTNIDDVKVVSDDEKMTIYSNNPKWNKVITKNLKNILDEIKLSNDLVDYAISLTNGRCFICMGYDDPLMVLPLEKQYNPNPITTFKNDLTVAMKVIEELNK